MKIRYISFLKCLTIVFLLNPALTNAQILKDSASLNLIKKSIDYIYNLRFDESLEARKKLSQAWPGHPANYLLEGLQIYWENYPLSPSSSACITFEKDLRRCIELCESNSSKADEAEYLLGNLSARGFLLLFYSDNDLTMSVIPLATSTYHFIRRSFDYTSYYSDFFFFTGLYDYTREAYPEALPGL